MYALLLWLMLLAQAAFAGATIQSAPRDSTERPAVASPTGGWWAQEGQYARVFAGATDSDTSRRLANHAAAAVPRLAARLGVPAGATIDVYLAPTQEDFDRLQPGVPPEWADGTAWPRWGIIFLRSPHARPGTAAPLEQVLDHELVHVLLGRAFAGPPPRWLQEGLAQYYAGELGPDTATTLSGVVFGRERLFALNALSRSFYADPLLAREAYAASADFVGFLAGRYGEAAVHRLIDAMAQGASFEAAVPIATGESMVSIEAAWAGRWSDPARWITHLEDVLWGLAAALVVVGAWRARRRTRATLARWEREEQWLFVDSSQVVN